MDKGMVGPLEQQISNGLQPLTTVCMGVFPDMHCL